MNTRENQVELSFRSYKHDRETEIRVDMESENVSEIELIRLLNAWLTAIGSNVVVREQR
jgi:hypothetical protein